MKTLLLFISLLVCYSCSCAQQAMCLTGNVKFHSGTQITFFGDLINNGTLTDEGTVVNFNGTAALSGSSVSEFNNVAVNSAGELTLQQSCTVANSLALVAGKVDLNSKTLTFQNPDEAAFTRTSGYIQSDDTDNSSRFTWLVANNTGPHIIPFGTASGLYIPLTLDITGGTLGVITVSTYPTASNNLPLPTSPVAVSNLSDAMGYMNSSTTVDRFWHIGVEGPGGTATITFKATGAEIGALSQLKAQRWNPSTQLWDAVLSGQTPTETSATVPGVTNFGTWDLTGGLGSLLANGLLFHALPVEDHVDLDWETTKEITNDFFTVERSRDLVIYQALERVEGAGTTSVPTFYTSRDDDPFEGVSYYRLRSTSEAGVETWTDPVAVHFKGAGKITLFPNPVTEERFTLLIHHHNGERLTMEITAMDGSLVYSQFGIKPDSEMYQLEVESPMDLSTGIYLVKVKGDFGEHIEKLIVQ